jgi:hypothetical protein
MFNFLKRKWHAWYDPDFADRFGYAIFMSEGKYSKKVTWIADHYNEFDGRMNTNGLCYVGKVDRWVQAIGLDEKITMYQGHTGREIFSRKEAQDAVRKIRYPLPEEMVQQIDKEIEAFVGEG